MTTSVPNLNYLFKHSLRDFPVIGAITGITKTILSVRDKLLVKKIASFLFELQDITEEEREKFINDIGDNKDYQRKVGESLIMLIDRLDDLDKPILMAKLLKALARRDINYHQFLRFVSVIDKMVMQDLKNFLNAILDDTGPEHFAEYLYPFGLSRIDFDDRLYVKTGSGFDEIGKSRTSWPPQNPIQFQLTEMTFLFAQILLGQEVGNGDYIADNRQRLQEDIDKGDS